MKWLIKLMLVMTLAFSGSVYAERTLDEVAAEARVSSSPVDTSDLQTFAISKNDAAAGLLNELSHKTLQEPLVKALAAALTLNTDELGEGGDFMEVFFDSIYFQLGTVLGTIILCFFGVFLVRNARLLKDKQAEKERMRKTQQFGVITLVAGLSINPKIASNVWGSFILIMIACVNWAALTITLYTTSDESEKKEYEAPTNPVLSQYDDNETVGVWNAVTEKITRSSVIAVFNVQLGRTGFLSSPLTKAALVNDLEKNVKLNIVPVFKDGTVTRLDFIYNEDYENYDSEKYGNASRSFSVKANNLQDTIDQGTEKDVARAVRLKAQQDGQSLFSADDFFNTLNSYESEAFAFVTDGKSREAKLKYDDALIARVALKMDDGLNSIKEQYLSAGYGAGMFKLYSLYASTFINAAQGLNPGLTYSGKWKYQQEAADNVWKYNCSYRDNQELAKTYINGFNILAGGTTWDDAGLIAAPLPTQCTTFMNGRAYYVGVDAETDEMNVMLFKDRTTAAGIAIGNLTSNITEGALIGQNKFLLKNNPYKNLALQFIDMGFVHVGLSSSALGKAMNYSSRVGNSVRNGITVEKAAGGEYNVGVDFQMLFGNDRKNLTSNSYKNISTGYKRMIFDALIDPAKAANVTTMQQALTYDDSDPDMGDMIINAIQNQSSLLVDRKKAMGLSVDKTFTQGIAECNANVDLCNKRATGTVSDLYSSETLKLGLYLKMGTTVISGLKQLDISDLLERFDLSGDSFVGKLLGKLGAVADKVGFLFKLGVFFLDVILVPLDAFANMLIGLGIWQLALSVIPAVMMIMLVVSMGLLCIATFITYYSFLFQAVIKQEPNYFYTGLKLILSDWIGVLFYLIGFEVMLYFINVIGTGKLERAIYGTVAGEGGLFNSLTALLMSLFVLTLLHTMCFGIPKMFMSFRDKITGSSFQILDQAASERTFSSIALSYGGEKMTVKMFDGLGQSLQSKAKSISEKWKSKPSEAPSSSKPASDTEGR